MFKTVLEYIWPDTKCGFRSKTRVLPYRMSFSVAEVPVWNYDGSSTGEIQPNYDSHNSSFLPASCSEIHLKPAALYKDPFREIPNALCCIVLCETYFQPNPSEPVLVPTVANTRCRAITFFSEEAISSEKPWFGLEQEYFITKSKNFVYHDDNYCNNTNNDFFYIMDKHLELCLKAGINIAGINTEVAPNQGEFQIGPSEGIAAADDLVVARYILMRIADTHGAKINYDPKPFSRENGSGCHINFSTKSSRDDIAALHTYISRLEHQCPDVLLTYGQGNEKRLIGTHETADINTFSWGIGTRNTSIRIPNQVATDKKGYLEDRRPAANLDPYLATAALCRACLTPDTRLKNVAANLEAVVAPF